MNPSWYPGEPGNRVPAPFYTTAATGDIVVADTFHKGHLWETAVAEAVALWEPSWLSFEIRQMDPPVGGLVLDGITFHAANLPTGVNGHATFAPPPLNGQDRYGAGWLAINRARYGYLRTLHATKLNHAYSHKKLRLYLAHEMGHCLGFDHGGTGIMNGAWKPNDEEIEALRDYYLF